MPSRYFVEREHGMRQKLLIIVGGLRALVLLPTLAWNGLVQQGNASGFDMFLRVQPFAGQCGAAACGVAGDRRRDADKLENAGKRHVMDVLRLAGGNRTLAPERLGTQRRTLYKKLERWDPMHEGHTAVPGAHDAEREDEE